MKGHLVKTDCSLLPGDGDITRAAIEQALHDGDLLWLDLAEAGPDAIAVLHDVFAFHPLAVDDAVHFGRRPKIENFDDFTFIVAYGARDADGDLTEMHVFYTERFMVTVHRRENPAVTQACGTLDRRKGTKPPAIVALYYMLDALVDSMFPYLATFDDRIDTLQDEIFVKPTEQQLAQISSMKRELVQLRRLVTPQRDMFASALAGVHDLVGMTADKERYFRDLYDHLIRISDLVDSYRDLLSAAMDDYLSMVSNRLNAVMKQLTIIATIFLPLSFLTGFFGQNFGWMVGHIGSFWTFVGLGLGSELGAVVGLLWLFRKRGWL